MVVLQEQVGQPLESNGAAVLPGRGIYGSEGTEAKQKPGLIVDGWDALLLAIMWTHVVCAPYTKVEESFNVQAIHDVLYHGADFAAYDHFEFPGVVPRTFLGALAVSALSSPAVAALRLLRLPKLYSLYAVRMVLAAIVAAAFKAFRCAVDRELGRPVGVALVLVTACQFHLLYYSSRPLPNTFALVLAYVAYGFWLSGKLLPLLRTLVFATVVFRCDLAILLGPIGLLLLATRELTFRRAFGCCAVAGVASLALTVAIDSAMWRRLAWPEGIVLFFNTALNKSSEWGVSPPHWYFSSALPRALLGSLPLSVVGLWLERRMLRYAAPVLAFVCLYSILPHKELRFVFVALPIFNLAAAAALARLYANRRRWPAAFAGAVALLAGSLLVTCLFALASYANYPGGDALARLHSRGRSHRDRECGALRCRGTVVALRQYARESCRMSLAGAVRTAGRVCRGSQKGPYEEQGVYRAAAVSACVVRLRARRTAGRRRRGSGRRVGRNADGYSKEEGLELDQYAGRGFDYLLSEHEVVPGFERVDVAAGFSRLRLAPAALPPVQIATEPKVYIHRALRRGEAGREESTAAAEP